MLDGFGPNPVFTTTWEAQLDGRLDAGAETCLDVHSFGRRGRLAAAGRRDLRRPLGCARAGDRCCNGTGGQRQRRPCGGAGHQQQPPTVGVSLTVGLGSIVDADGEPSPLDVQWLRGNTNTVIPGATSTTYVPTAADLGQTLRVRVSYTDLQGTAETLLSTPTAASGRGPGDASLVPTPVVLDAGWCRRRRRRRRWCRRRSCRRRWCRRRWCRRSSSACRRRSGSLDTRNQHGCGAVGHGHDGQRVHGWCAG